MLKQPEPVVVSRDTLAAGIEILRRLIGGDDDAEIDRLLGAMRDAARQAGTAVLVVFFSWNEFLFALVLTGPHTQTVPIGVSAFVGTVSVDWSGSSAAAVLAMIPMFVLGLLIQRFLVSGLAMGAVKG